MRSRTRLNIALVGGLLIIGSLFWLSFRDQAGGDPLLDLAADDVTEMTLLSDGMTRWQVNRQDGDWQLLEPIVAPVHRERFERLLQLLRMPVHARYTTEEADPARFGLDEPVLEIRVNGKQLLIGDAEPVNRRRYVQMGDEIALVDEVFYFQFARPAEIIMDRRLLPEGSAIESMDFPNFRVSRDAGAWSASGDAPEGLEGDNLDRLLSNWRQAEAESLAVLPSEVDETGQDERTIRIHLDDGTSLRYVILDRGDDLYLARPDLGLVYRIPASQRRALLAGG